jgi:hypothetical protein
MSDHFFYLFDLFGASASVFLVKAVANAESVLSFPFG